MLVNNILVVKYCFKIIMMSNIVNKIVNII